MDIVKSIGLSSVTDARNEPTRKSTSSGSIDQALIVLCIQRDQDDLGMAIICSRQEPELGGIVKTRQQEIAL
jgi:hypothetical protein